MAGPQDKAKTFDKERVSFNLARLRMYGHVFEVVVEPDAAVEYKSALKSRQEKHMAEVGEPDIVDVLRSEEVFHDAHKGQLASEHLLQETFGTADPVEVAKRILLDGEVQLTAEHRKKMMEMKWKQLSNMIHKYAVDPKTGYPHPAERIERLLRETHFNLDQYKKVEDQLEEAVHALKPIVPIKFDTKEIEVKIFKEYAPKIYGDLKRYKVVKESWNSDGSLTMVFEIPAGLRVDFVDKINEMTHGSVEIEVRDRE